MTPNLSGRNDEFVLRKQPTGRLLDPTAHDMRKEFNLLKLLKPFHLPIPNVHVFCQDESVVGSQFYVMEYVRGRIYHDVRQIVNAMEWFVLKRS